MNAPFHDQGRSKEGKLGGEIALLRQIQVENSSVRRNTNKNTNWELYLYGTNTNTKQIITHRNNDTNTKTNSWHTHPCETVSVKSPMTIEQNPISLVQILTS